MTGRGRPLIALFWRFLKTRKHESEIICQTYRGRKNSQSFCFSVWLHIQDRKDNLDIEPPGHHVASQMGTPGVVQVTKTCPPLNPCPTNGHLSQSHDNKPCHCQNCHEICMKQGCLAVVGSALINDSIHRRPMQNTFIIH